MKELIGISVITVSNTSEGLLKNILLNNKDVKLNDVKIKDNEIWVDVQKATLVIAVIKSMKLQYSHYVKNFTDEIMAEKAFAERKTAAPQGISKKAMRKLRIKARANA